MTPSRLELSDPATFGLAEMLDAWPEPERMAKARAAAARIEELKREWPPEHHRQIVPTVADENGVDPSTVSRWLKLLERAPGAPRGRGPQRRGPKATWTDDRVKAAIEAWWDRYGQPPTRADWSPAQLKYRGRSTVQRRLQAFSEGWIDPEGSWRPFPTAETVVPFQRLVEEVAVERRRRGKGS